MSRIGKMPINIVKGVEAVIKGNVVSVKGPKGALETVVHPDITVKMENDTTMVLERHDEKKTSKSLHGLYRVLINNMVVGVSTGFTKILEVKGTGYKFELKGNKIGFSLGFSHPVEMELPKGVSAEVKPNELTLMSPDKQVLGDFAAKIKALRPVEPYKGKGIFYKGEAIRRKAGKAAGK